MDLLEQIHRAGIVGAAGMGFPTDIKLNVKADTLIANGIECDLLLNTNRCEMEVFAHEIVQGLRAAAEQVGASDVVIAIREKNSAALQAMQDAAHGMNIRFYISDSVYPAGDEVNLTYQITGRMTPPCGHPADVGCVVINVSTLRNIAHALQGKPVTERVVTVTGAVSDPQVMVCSIGTPFSALINAAGGSVEDSVYLVGGGIAGTLIEHLNGNVSQTTGGLIALPRQHILIGKKRGETFGRPTMCTQCGFCTQMCPRNAMGYIVQPHKAMRACMLGDSVFAEKAVGAYSCSGCGVCTLFACQFGLDPAGYMRDAHNSLLETGMGPIEDWKKGTQNKVQSRGIPMDRLLKRLDLEKYDKVLPFNAEILDCEYVEIPLRTLAAEAAVPVVDCGQWVEKGQQIARANGISANIYASISGQITEITKEWIKIQK